MIKTTTVRKEIIKAWKTLRNNNKKIRKLLRENKKIEAMIGKHLRSRSAWRTMKKGKGK